MNKKKKRVAAPPTENPNNISTAKSIALRS
jgi:hypothetical protein